MKQTSLHALAGALLAIFTLAGCGGTDSLTKSVTLDKYSDSCDGDSWKTVSRTSGDQTILMSVTVNTEGNVEPLKPEWSAANDNSIGGSVKSATATIDGTGRKFTQTVVVTSTGDLSYKLKVRDKNDDKRFETTCKVHVN